jgi:N-6 DNA Methylase
MIEHARAHGGVTEGDQLHYSLVGADQSAASVAMARVNLLAYGLPPSEVFTVEDSITAEPLDRLRGTLRLILTNPPFGESKYDSLEGIDRTATLFGGLGAKSRIDPSLAFVARCIELLAPDGVVGIILPDGVADGSQMRDLLLGAPKLIDAVHLAGVISLPSATFAPAGTVAKTSVVFMRKSPSSGGRVFLARADHVGHVMRKGVAASDPEGDDLPRLTNDVCTMLKDADGAKVAKSIQGQVASVNISLLTAVDAASVDADALKARQTLLDAGGQPLSRILRATKRRRTSRRKDLPFVSVLHVDELGNVDWLQAEKYHPTTAGIVARAGQIIVSLLNPAKFRAAVVPNRYAEIECSAEFGVFDSAINPYAALALLQHELVRAQIAPLGRGTSSSRRRIESSDVMGLIAPLHDDSWIEKTGDQVAEALAAVAEARSRLTDAYSM